ncbi:hypothetical protein B9G54_06500 [Alloscardovia macacae]|uniref:LysM domain-containing protein n=1 Tax=Alloscardovia macacae TaxID=1160091 RepID=A0A1Y2SSV4_9BIFI|nr:LysM peptidoglycan-binding domain-containing protein [Alloscardovia macacae]OTA25909.1 hypothetical protein B9G54_06500 [Alloscardovia macacae]OTA28272.1 hypothetical protein B9T39_07065 [Alloscardovia macacae]
MGSMMDAGNDATYAGSLYVDADTADVDDMSTGVFENFLMSGRGVFTVLGLAVVVLVCAVAFMLPQAAADNGEDELVRYTVQPQETLWSYAQQVTPEGADVYATMKRIKRINHLSSDQLVVGQTLLVPQA